MSMADAIFYAIVLLVCAFIVWLLVIPAPGHDPLLVLRHAGKIA